MLWDFCSQLQSRHQLVSSDWLDWHPFGPAVLSAAVLSGIHAADAGSKGRQHSRRLHVCGRGLDEHRS